MNSFKPMLAAPTDGNQLRYPILASPKLDGVRAHLIGGRVLSRKLLAFPNKALQKLLGFEELNGLDGELIVGEPGHSEVYRRTQSVTSSIAAPVDELRFYVFDDFGAPGEFFGARLKAARARVKAFGSPLKIVPHKPLKSAAELKSFEEASLEFGYEGIMLRDPTGPYKYGRSTLNEGWLMKLKRFADSEAVIISSTCLYTNDNTKQLDALGHAKRSSAAAGKRPIDTLGSLTVRDLKSGATFEIGTGFTSDMRRDFWKNREKLKGRIVKYKYFPTGSKDKPRFPVFIFFREKWDM